MNSIGLQWTWAANLGVFNAGHSRSHEVLSVSTNSPPTDRCILIVEDHGETSSVMARLVRSRGLQAVTASSVAEARACARQGNVGFLISDLGLPDGNGCDLMIELRERLGINGVAITGYGMEMDLTRTQQAGFALHLIKPIAMSDFERVLTLAKAELARPDSRPRPE